MCCGYKGRGGELPYDAVVLIGRRPEACRADVLVYGSARDVDRVRLRDVALDSARMDWLAAALLRLSWVGFSP